MNQTDRPEFLKIISALASTFGREVDEAMLTGYWLGLDDLPLTTIEDAARRLIRLCQFMPTVRDIRGATGELSQEARTAVAWEALLGAISIVGGYRSIEFDDPCLAATVRQLGGWERLCEMPEDEFDRFMQPRFERCYRANLGRDLRHVCELLGTFERQNTLGNQPIAPAEKFVTGLVTTAVIEHESDDVD